MKKLLFGLFLMIGWLPSARAASVGFGDFNTNQFSVAGNKVSLLNGAFVTNLTFNTFTICDPGTTNCTTYIFPLTNYVSGQLITVITNGTNVYFVGTNLPVSAVVFDTIEELVATPIPLPGIGLLAYVRDPLRGGPFAFYPQSIKTPDNFKVLASTDGPGNWERPPNPDIRVEWGVVTGGVVTNATLVAALALQSAQGFGKVIYSGTDEFLYTDDVPLLENNVLFFEDGAQATGLNLSANSLTNVAVYGPYHIAAVASPSTGAYHLTNSTVLIQSPRFLGYSGNPVINNGSSVRIFSYDTLGLVLQAGNGLTNLVVSDASGYSGAGTKALFDDGTFKPAATINPTDNYLPVRLNSTTFGDSPLYSGFTNRLGFNSTNTALYLTAFDVGLGRNALSIQTSANANTAIGVEALKIANGGVNNTAVGYRALYSLTTGGENNAFGLNSLFTLSTGANNTAYGNSALLRTTIANNNTALGHLAGLSNTVGEANVFVGYLANPSKVNSINEIVIGERAIGNGDNTATIGSASVTELYLGNTLIYPGGGSQTPWASDIDGALFSLTNVGRVNLGNNALSYSGNVLILTNAATATPEFRIVSPANSVTTKLYSDDNGTSVLSSSGTLFLFGGGTAVSLYPSVFGPGSSNVVDLGTPSQPFKSLYLGAETLFLGTNVYSDDGSDLLRNGVAVGGAGGITGSGTENYLLKWGAGGTTAGDSNVREDGTEVRLEVPLNLNGWDINMGGGDIGNLASLTASGIVTAGNLVSTGATNYMAGRLGIGTAADAVTVLKVGGAGEFSGQLRFGTGLAFSSLGRSVFISPADGDWVMYNNTGSTFGKLQFGGQSASEPAIGRSGTSLVFQLADGTGAADMQIGVSAASPAAGTIHGAHGVGTDKVGGDITIAGGQGTGTGTRGTVKVKSASVGTTGSSANAYTTAVAVGGTLKVDSTTTGNVGAGEDNLISYSVPAGQLAVDKDFLEYDVWGTFAANVNTKQVKIYFGATVLLDTTSLIFNGVAWRGHGKIVRTGAATQKVTCEFTVGGTLLSAVNSTITAATYPTETLSGAVTFKVTGTDTGGVPADNAVVQDAMTIQWKPGN